jgi:hypothetical protein
LAPYTHPTFAFFPSLVCGHYLSSLTALCALLSYPLTVVLLNIPYSHGTTLAGYTVLTYLSITILSVMIFTLTISFFRPLKPNLRNKPTTIAAVLVMIYRSRTVWAFQGLGAVEGKERDQRIAEMGRSYGFGVVIGLDGVARWGVDFDEFVDYSK